MFSIIIPSFNNFEYLKLCVNSIKKNSKFNHQIILHINEGSDGSLDYVKENNIEHTYSKKNIGLCSAANLAAKKAITDYIIYSHDDMYFCPEWDEILFNEINKTKTNLYYFSGTMIDPNGGHIRFDCGDKVEDFNEEKLLNNYKKLNYFDYQGSNWAPHLIRKEIWDEIGGFSEEFNPGFASDPDLNMKLWNKGVRIFKGLSKLKVYHFGSISLRKKSGLIRNKGSRQFLKKWGITISFFKKYYLRSNTEYFDELDEPNKNFYFYKDLLFCKIQKFFLFLFRK
ncbi:glycosyltransferase family 2 protein [Candidatus Pelagibacter sp. HIMB1748]|uniref:glycosyltransferase family 2 protein n=1 Tax=unclassified Candidatus Pelagibacter TaxID=2647897 RepID=UPI003F86F237